MWRASCLTKLSTYSKLRQNILKQRDQKYKKGIRNWNRSKWSLLHSLLFIIFFCSSVFFSSRLLYLRNNNKNDYRYGWLKKFDMAPNQIVSKRLLFGLTFQQNPNWRWIVTEKRKKRMKERKKHKKKENEVESCEYCLSRILSHTLFNFVSFSFSFFYSLLCSFTFSSYFPCMFSNYTYSNLV